MIRQAFKRQLLISIMIIHVNSRVLHCNNEDMIPAELSISRVLDKSILCGCLQAPKVGEVLPLGSIRNGAEKLN
jgi:hypothetical protein